MKKRIEYRLKARFFSEMKLRANQLASEKMIEKQKSSLQ